MRVTCVLFFLVLASTPLRPTSADFLNSIASGISSATSTVSNGVSTAAGAVSGGVGTAVTTVGSGLNTAANATANGLSTAANATSSGVSTAANATSRWVTTATGSVRDVYNVSRETVESFTSSVQTALSPVASTVGNTAENLGSQVYNVSAGTYQGIVNYGQQQANSAAGTSPPASLAPSAAPTVSENTTVDATNATSIIGAITTNSSGFIGVANSLLVALGQNKSAGVESGIRNIVNNSTGNTTYPSAGLNNTVSLGLAQAVVTALVTANNYTVTVNFQGRSNTVNATQVANVFLAGLQDGLTPCARNVSTTTNATSGSEQYFSAIASGCCFLVAQPLTYTVALAQSNAVGSVMDAGLQRSQTLGQAPSLDLTRCLTNATTAS